VDAVFHDLQIDGFRWRSWDGKLHYKLAAVRVTLCHRVGRNPDPIFRHLGTLRYYSGISISTLEVYTQKPNVATGGSDADAVELESALENSGNAFI
jgi:hypothetical protein